ncbi:hypothetical protein [Fibrobacter sp. UWB3]|uniref:hypothetical protein n=1 Tax=Fibrobacter sp. UWB3 TaxID=1964357 RepID=UPI0020CC0933|nr:hypothetical protein [Fibrobacter sp. UWB3]
MNFLKAFAIVAIVGGIVACSDENASAVWNSAELSSSTVIPDSKVSEPAEVPESSSGVVIPDSVPGTPSSSSTENVAQSSSSETVADTVWHQANLTWYTSWPEPDSEECIEYNGCTWAGYFAGVEGQMTEEWVSQHNIIAVHEKDWNQYKLKTFRLRMNGSTIDAVVYDMCSDSDCDGCCTENAGEIGFLIDIEKYTRERFDGNGDGVVEWTCLDCE